MTRPFEREARVKSAFDQDRTTPIQGVPLTLTIDNARKTAIVMLSFIVILGERNFVLLGQNEVETRAINKHHGRFEANDYCTL